MALLDAINRNQQRVAQAREERDAYNRALASVPRGILGYLTGNTASEIGEDIGGLLGSMKDFATENTGEFAAGFLPIVGQGMAIRDMARTQAAINQAEAQGDTATADRLRQMNVINALGLIPFGGGFARSARRGFRGGNVDTSYRMAHQPRGPDVEDPIRLDNLTRSTTGEVAGYPDDFYTNRGQRIYAQGPRFQGDEYGIANLESYRAINSARNNPEAEVTIYRAVPQGINDINSGDFVTLSPKYAELHSLSGYGRNGDQAGHVISQTVRVKDIFWDGNDVNEFGYFPQR